MDESFLEKKECKDGSFTLHRKDIDESYHSPVGAALEAREKYVAPCNIATRAKQGTLHILDVCFGFGYNTAAALDVALEDLASVRVTALELDKDILAQSLELPFPFKHKELFVALANHFDEEQRIFSCADDMVQIKLFIGDALERINEVSNDVDVVFFDPFSPKKSPELWSADFFRKVYEKCKDGAILATYSCARGVRDAMRQAGFIVEDGPVVGRRGPATLGRVTKSS